MITEQRCQDTPRRWRVNDAGNVKRGVVPKLTDAMVTVVNDLASRVRLVRLSSVIMQSSFEVHLAKLCRKWRPSKRLVRAFLNILTICNKLSGSQARK